MLLVLLACNRKLPLEASFTGVKPGTSMAQVHVKSEKGVSVECLPEGLTCDRFDIGASGEKDIEVDLNSNYTKKLMLRAKIGPREATYDLPINATSAVPATVAIDDKGKIECGVKTCKGTLSVAPIGHVTMTTEPGTVVEVGSTKLTADASGKVDAAVDLPSMKTQPLKTLCSLSDTSLGASTLTLTFADKTTVTTPIAITSKLTSASLGAWAQAAEKGPLLFPWEKGAANKGSGAIYAMSVACFTTSTGKLDDLSVIVLAKDVTRDDTCKYALSDSNDKDRGTATGNLTLHDDDATAYDRASGKSLGKRTFKAEHHCRSDFTVKRDEKIPDQDAFANPVPIEQWGASLAR